MPEKAVPSFPTVHSASIGALMTPLLWLVMTRLVCPLFGGSVTRSIGSSLSSFLGAVLTGMIGGLIDRYLAKFIFFAVQHEKADRTFDQSAVYLYQSKRLLLPNAEKCLD